MTGIGFLRFAKKHNLNAVGFVDSANDDYHLSVNDTLARNQGEDLSATFTDDVDGQSRSSTAAGASWDIGADEQIAVGITIGGWD